MREEATLWPEPLRKGLVLAGELYSHSQTLLLGLCLQSSTRVGEEGLQMSRTFFIPVPYSELPFGRGRLAVPPAPSWAEFLSASAGWQDGSDLPCLSLWDHEQRELYVRQPESSRQPSENTRSGRLGASGDDLDNLGGEVMGSQDFGGDSNHLDRSGVGRRVKGPQARWRSRSDVRWAVPN